MIVSGIDIHHKKDHHPTNMEIINVSKVENGIVVNFKDGVCALFDAAFLYAQKDKRIEVDFGDSPSASSNPGW
jgi:hypothetical protein